MPRNPKYHPPGFSKGKTLTFAETNRIDELRSIASEAMLELFELQPDEYLISDESDLLDFVPMEHVGAPRPDAREASRPGSVSQPRAGRRGRHAVLNGAAPIITRARDEDDAK